MLGQNFYRQFPRRREEPYTIPSVVEGLLAAAPTDRWRSRGKGQYVLRFLPDSEILTVLGNFCQWNFINYFSPFRLCQNQRTCYNPPQLSKNTPHHHIFYESSIHGRFSSL